MIKICFVCLGNICRSPTAEGVMLRLVRSAGLADRIAVDSAGTGAYHTGERADRRARTTAEARGVELTSRARQFTVGDFDRFDYVVAMDRDNRDDLLAMAEDEAAGSRVFLLRAFDVSGADELDVPDPYHGEPGGFDAVFDLCEAGCQGLLERIRVDHGLGPS